MGETALNFGPDWLRALAHGPGPSSQPPSSAIATIPKYSLAQYRYGREEMLALIPKDPKKPEYLKRDTSKVVRDTFVLPLALTPATEDEQRLWSRPVNSDAVLRASGKSVPGNNMGRSGRGGSVDRGRGRGRGGYYQRGITYEESEDGPPSSFSRPKPIERSQSASEKDQRWDDRDRRFDRPFSGRGGVDDSMIKPEQSRNSNEYWRKFDKDDENDWRSSNPRSSDKTGTRGSWRNPVDSERRDLERNPVEKDRRDPERNPSSRSLNGNSRGSHSHQKTPGTHLPEWSVEESNEQDVVGTFDSSGAFLETKMANNNSLDDIYVSDDADEGMSKDSPEAKKDICKRTPKKSNSQSQISTSLKQNSVKPTQSVKKTEELSVEKHPPKQPEPHTNNKTLTSVIVNKAADRVIKTNAVQHNIVNNKKNDYIPVSLPNVPEVAKSTKCDNVILSHVKTAETSVPSAAVEEDAFAHHKKATENMVAQWTEEEEQRVISQSTAPVPEKENKWFYQDPQGEIQGPFTSPEMLEWFSAGYFTMSLMVRRSFDEKFSQLGDLIKSWSRVPFMPGNSPPPIRVTPMTSSLPTPVTQTIVPNPVATPVATQLPKQDEQLMALQQQLLQQQLLQQQLMLRQAQLQQILSQLKQQDNFTSLNTQQQQQVLLQQFMAQQQMPRPNLPGVSEQPPNLVETMTPLPLPLLGLPMAPLLKNDLSLWNMTPASSPWPINVGASQPSGTSIWDVDPLKNGSEESESEKQKRLAEEQEKLRKAEEVRLSQEKEMEEKRKLDELRRKQEEERLLKELQKQVGNMRLPQHIASFRDASTFKSVHNKDLQSPRLQTVHEEDKKRLEEQQRREEEKRRQEELRRLEEQKRKEEELRKQEELRKIEEQKRLEELKIQEELRRIEELKRKEEERRQEELRKKEEQRKLEEKRKKEELQRKLEMEQERERIELEKQKEAARLKEIEREQQLQRERQKQKEKEEEMKRLAEIKLKSQGPAWGVHNAQKDSHLSLLDIQRLQGEKDKEERDEKERVRQQLLQQQAAIKQTQQSKNGLSWAKRSSESQLAVKSLVEIQLEEAERLSQLQRNQKPQAPAPVISSNVGVWGNASHLNRITAAPPSWSMNNVATSGFWDDALISTQVKKPPTKQTNDSAFPALTNPEKPATTVHSNKSKNVRAKKEEEAIAKLFANRVPTDEFTAWCTEALSAMPSSVDVLTFVAFLKDIESPYEVHDYVKSYLGDGKEPREFAKQFLDRRSKFRAKQIPIEDNTLWGPAPAITPVVNKSNSQPSNDNDGNSNSKGKTKRRKNRMQKMDISMLGFTVQSNPDRLNVGEIDHGEGV